MFATELFTTEFSYNNSFNQYELKVDGSKFDVTVEWLNKFGCRFQYTAFSRYVLFELINPSQTVINVLTAKFNPQIVDERFEYLSSLHDDDLTVIVYHFASKETYHKTNEIWGDINKVWQIIKDELPELKELTDYLDYHDYQEYETTDHEKWYCNDSSNFWQFVFTNCNTVAEIKAEYRRLAKTMHPDAGGNADEFVKLNEQYQQALQLVAA